MPPGLFGGRTEDELLAVLEGLSASELDAVVAAFEMPACSNCRASVDDNDGE